MINIYIAAPWELKEKARELAKLLESKIEECKASPRWFDHKDGDNEQDCIDHDHEDINNCDVFLLLNPEEWKYKGTGGRHYETGYAYAKGKDIAVLGEATNLFLKDPAIYLFNNEEDLIYWLTQ